MNKKIPKKLILLIILTVILLPSYAEAWSLFDFSENVGEIFLKINSVFISLLGKMLGWSVQMFTGIIKWQDFEDVAVVKTSWTIVRDFVNMFFILVLVIVSFGTIFGLEKYSITTPGLLSKIIIAALLINFSLAIGGMIIDVSQIFSGVFLNSMGDFAGNLGAGLNLNKIFNIEAGGEFAALAGSKDLSPDKFIGKSVIDSFFTLIIIGILLLSMLAAAIFSFIRIPILWGLLIISPAAWLLGILPFSQNLSKKWWDYFIGWTFFLPSYLFMMVIGTAILKNRTQIDPLFDKFKTDSSFASLGNFALQDIFFYIVAIMILTGSLAGSLKVGRFASVGASGAFGKVKGGVDRLAGRWSGVTAIRGGVKQVGERIKEEGVPRFKIGGWQPFKGVSGEREREAKWAGRFGRPFGLAPEFKAQKEFITKANKEYDSIKQQYEIGKLTKEQLPIQARRYGATDPRGFAYRKLLAELGQLDDISATETMKSLSNNPFALQEFAKTAREKGKFSNIKEETLIRMAAAEGEFKDFGTGNYLPARREIYRHIQSDPKTASRLKWEEFKKGVEIFGGGTTAEGKSYLKDLSKVRPDFAIKYNKEADLIRPKLDNTMPTDYELMRDSLKGVDLKDVANMPLDLWDNAEFKETIRNNLTDPRLSIKTRNNYRSRLEGYARDSFSGDEKLRILQQLGGPAERQAGEAEERGGRPRGGGGGGAAGGGGRPSGGGAPPTVVPPSGAEGLTQTEIEEKQRAREALEEERRRSIEERGQGF